MTIRRPPNLPVALPRHHQGVRPGGALVRALRGVDLEIDAGEMTLLVGPSGCGKTTLISIIAGICEPTAGERLGAGRRSGRDCRGGGKCAFRGGNVGFVFQQFNLLPALTAAENVTVPLILARWPRRKALARGARLCWNDGHGRPDAIALPTQALGRAAAAGGDRPRAGPRAAAAGLRRTDFGPRRPAPATRSWNCSATSRSRAAGRWWW